MGALTIRDAVEFWIPDQPISKARARVATRDRHGQPLAKATSYTPARSKNYSAIVALYARSEMAGAALLLGPLEMRTWFAMRVPKSWAKAKRVEAEDGYIAPTVKPDLSNLVKQIEDACNGIVYRDDAQIVESSERKYYAETDDDVGVRVRFVVIPSLKSA